MATAADARSDTLLTPRFVRVLLVQFCFGLSWSTYLLLPKFMVEALDASAADIGFAQGVPPATGVLLAPVCGYVIDRVGRRPVAIAGILLQLFYAAGFLAVTGVGAGLLALQALQGAAFTLTFNANATLAADLAPPARIGQAMGLFGTANVATNAIAPTVAEFIEGQLGWSWAFVVPILPALVALWLCGGMQDTSLQGLASSAMSPESSRSGTTAGVRDLLSRVAYDTLTMLAVGAGFATVFTYYQPYAVSLGVSQVGSFFIGFTGAVVVMRLGLGSRFDRLGLRRVAMWASALYAVVVLAVTELSASLLLPLGAAFGVAHGVLYPTLHALAVQSVQPSERGRANAFINGGFQVGIACSVAALGPLVDRFGYAFAFWIGAGCAGVAWLMLALRTRLRAEGPLA